MICISFICSAVVLVQKESKVEAEDVKQEKIPLFTIFCGRTGRAGWGRNIFFRVPK